jgi:DNA helicase-2/ATP-dependent DNA helicase PcrA
MTKFTPSHYQSTIFDFIADGNGDAVVDAVPGSGKTTTCIEGSKRLRSNRALFLAFNRHIAQELNQRLAGMKAQTIHSLGMSALRPLGNPQVEPYKYSNLIQRYLKDKRLNDTDFELAKERIQSLLSLTQLTLTDPRDEAALANLANHFDLDTNDWELTSQAVAPILKDGIALASEVIDFNDMVWLPHTLKLQPRKVDWLFVDEAQDLNKAQLELVLKCRASGGRILFVGDKRQALYAFAGADSRSIQNVINRTKAKILPLSICYRCPIKHVELAAQIYPGIEPAPRAIAGTIEEMAEDDLPSMVQEGDLILCRENAPLIHICLKLIRCGIPAKVRGRDISKSLKSVLKQVQQYEGYTFKLLLNYLDKYRDEQVALKQQHDNSEMAIAVIEDKVATIKAIYHFCKPTCIANLLQTIANLFSDDRASVWLSTVHKAKGLEAERVFVLYPDKIPHPHAKKDWEMEQEMNGKYVALTRSKRDLFLVYE